MSEGIVRTREPLALDEIVEIVGERGAASARGDGIGGVVGSSDACDV